MKRLYFFAFAVFAFAIVFPATAQLSISPNPSLNDNVLPDVFEGVAYATITNGFSQPQELTWERTELFITEGWTSAVCDVNQCYLPHVASQDFVLNKNQSGAMDVHVYPNGIEGGAIIQVDVFVTDDPSISTSATYYFNFGVGLTEKFTEKVKVYPNPTADYIYIDDSNTALFKVELYDVTGKLVVSQSLNDGSRIDLYHLPAGHYILKLLDKESRLVSTNHVVKE